MSKKNAVFGGSGTLTVVTQLNEDLANVLSAIEKNGFYWSITMRVDCDYVCFDIELGNPRKKIAAYSCAAERKN